MQQHTKQLLEFLRRRRSYIIVAFVLLVFFLVLGIVSDTGQRIFSATGITDSGSITVVPPRADVRIYLDDRLEEQVATADSSVELPHLPTGEHTLIAAKPNYHPWTKTIEVQADATTILHPFLVPRTPQQTPIPSSHEQYPRLLSLMRSAETPTEESPVRSMDASVEAWVGDGAVHARWVGSGERPAFFCPFGSDSCMDTITITSSQAPIKDLDFYKHRNDVVILSANEGVYALEITNNATQNFQPIYEGANPRFIKTGTSIIAVFDNQALHQISL